MDGILPSSSDGTAPSSPAPAVFSDDTKRQSSPLSSPPGFPWDQDYAPKQVAEPLQPSAFSILGKRKALTTISDNVRSTKKAVVAPPKPSKVSLSQMQISLGQEVQKRCKTCGMEYVLSSAEDRKLHDKYHKQNTEGYDVGKGFLKWPDAPVYEGAKKGDEIHSLGCRSRSLGKRRAKEVLAIVQRELGAVEIDAVELWDHRSWKEGKLPRYRSFLYIRGTTCIGYLLAERISEARKVVEPAAKVHQAPVQEAQSTNRKSSAGSALKARLEAAAEEARQAEAAPIELSKSSHKASLGIARIWTSSAHRRQNIATRLLDAALKDHASQCWGEQMLAAGSASRSATSAPNWMAEQFKPIKRKEDVAFSQPTSSGARLARGWFGRTYGWKVYVD